MLESRAAVEPAREVVVQGGIRFRTVGQGLPLDQTEAAPQAVSRRSRLFGHSSTVRGVADSGASHGAA